MRRFIFLLSLASLGLLISQQACAADILLREGWQIQASGEVNKSGDVISSAEFAPKGWHAATVPSTIMGARVKDGTYKDVFVADNIKKISTEPFQKSWWYRSEFKLPDGSKGNALLEFDGINYKANIWLNGKLVADSKAVAGAFRRFSFNVSDQARFGEQANVLAIEVFPPDKTGPSPDFWDWNPAAPDHNMGLFREVRVRLTGPVSLFEPRVRTKLDQENYKQVALSISVEAKNHTDRPIAGTAVAKIEDIQLVKKVELAAHEIKSITFSTEEFSQLLIDNPRLWWTHDLGKPELYQLQLSFRTTDGQSDAINTRFGVREVETYFNSAGARGFKLNGVPILVLGGGWADDIFLDYSPAKLRSQIDYARHMHLNALRTEGFFGNNQELYDLCDENGILLLVGWMCAWEYAHYDGSTPEQLTLLRDSWADQVKWLRIHPSILTWLYGSDQLTRPATEQAYLKVFSELDPNRPTISSAAEVTSKITGKSGVQMGPYDYNTPAWWYQSAKGFNTETGPGVQVPPVEAFKTIMPADNRWPPNAAWNIHAARDKGFGSLANHTKGLRQHIGEATDLDDFWRKSELLSYESVRAMFEGWRGKAPDTTGVIMWMFNSAWPKLQWQLFDYSLAPTSAFYATRKACEPVHIQYDPVKQDVLVVNSALTSSDNLSAEARVLNFDASQVWAKQATVAAAPNGVTKVFSLPKLDQLSGVYFLDLKLSDSQEKIVSQSIYCLSTDKKYDLSDLAKLPQVEVRATQTREQSDGKIRVAVELENANAKDAGGRGNIALLVALHFTKGAANAPLGPVFLDDNYVSILPGQKQTIHASIPTDALSGDELHVSVTGWNMKPLKLF